MISLPDLFADVLNLDAGLHQSVRKTFDLFEPWLEQSGMPFFQGYTDHSPRHINDVLKTAASLISDKSRSLLSPEDIAVLCISILLHDCGMHLTHDGFRTLVLTSQQPVVSGLGDRPWAELWNNFLSEASRFNEETLTAIFGNSEPYRIDLLNLENLSERDCLLIGEFVRRHHTRLAHEVAVNGVPAPPGQTPLRVIGLDHDFCDIAGLVARSHGMSIRQTFDYIETKYGLKSEYRRVKIPFLMALLRIADYMQVQSERGVSGRSEARFPSRNGAPTSLFGACRRITMTLRPSICMPTRLTSKHTSSSLHSSKTYSVSWMRAGPHWVRCMVGWEIWLLLG